MLNPKDRVSQAKSQPNKSSSEGGRPPLHPASSSNNIAPTLSPTRQSPTRPLGDDTMNGDSGADNLNGRVGNDEVNGGAGDGGDGDDYVEFCRSIDDLDHNMSDNEDGGEGNGTSMLDENCGEGNDEGEKMPTISSRIGTSHRIDESTNENQQTYEAVVPIGVSPGQTFTTMADGNRVDLCCPQNAKPGSTRIRFQLNIYEAVVPRDVSPGQTFTTMVDGNSVGLFCPQTAKPGSTIRFQLKTYETVVPRDVSPGQTFSLMVEGKRVNLCCPQNANPGDTVPFQLAILEGTKEEEGE